MRIRRDCVSHVGFREPTPSVVWQRRSVSVQHLLQRYKRYGECSRQALGTRHSIRNDQCIREEVRGMELEGRCFLVDAFPKANIHPECRHPWSTETCCHRAGNPHSAGRNGRLARSVEILSRGGRCLITSTAAAAAATTTTTTADARVEHTRVNRRCPQKRLSVAMRNLPQIWCWVQSTVPSVASFALPSCCQRVTSGVNSRLCSSDDDVSYFACRNGRRYVFPSYVL